MRALQITAALIVANLAACAAGPNYRAPKPDLPPQYASQPRAAALPSAAPGVDLASWWRSLNDEELDRLVDRAVKSNLDLAIALDRLQQARTYEALIVGTALPEVDATAAAGRGTGSDLAR